MAQKHSGAAVAAPEAQGGICRGTRALLLQLETLAGCLLGRLGSRPDEDIR